jgi:chromosome segregation ATPase
MGKLEDLEDQLEYFKNASNRHELLIGELKEAISTMKVNHEVLRQAINRLTDRNLKFNDLLNSITESLADIKKTLEGQIFADNEESEEDEGIEETLTPTDDQWKQFMKALLDREFIF